MFPALSFHRSPHLETLPSIFTWTPVLLTLQLLAQTHFLEEAFPGFLFDPFSKPTHTFTSCHRSLSSDREQELEEDVRGALLGAGKVLCS